MSVIDGLTRSYKTAEIQRQSDEIDFSVSSCDKSLQIAWRTSSSSTL